MVFWVSTNNCVIWVAFFASICESTALLLGFAEFATICVLVAHQTYMVVGPHKNMV